MALTDAGWLWYCQSVANAYSQHTTGHLLKAKEHMSYWGQAKTWTLELSCSHVWANPIVGSLWNTFIPTHHGLLEPVNRQHSALPWPDMLFRTLWVSLCHPIRIVSWYKLQYNHEHTQKIISRLASISLYVYSICISAGICLRRNFASK